MAKMSCKTCRFWSAYPDGAVRSVSDDRWGQCRRNPPIYYGKRNDQNEWTAIVLASDWPASDETHWCGEHREAAAACIGAAGDDA